MKDSSRSEIEVIIPNLNRRFSGITSTVAQVVPHQAKELEFAVVGSPLPIEIPHLGWSELVRIGRRPLPTGRPRIFHARRNNEMVAGLLLKWVFGCRLHLVFTSTAQRRHSRLTRFLYRHMDTLLSTSPRAASFLVRQPDAIIPHGIDSETYHPAEDRGRAWREGGLPGKHGIGIFGRVRPQKGIREFVEALCAVLPDHPEYTAVIVGQVTPKHRAFAEEMKSLIRKHGLEERFRWMGKLPFEEIPLWFRRMSLVVCASRNEGFGLTCLEAMASGVPVIATRAGAWEMIIRDRIDGWLVPTGDPHALAQAADTALGNRARLTEMGGMARSRILEDFTIERESRALNRVYRDILGGWPYPL
ncbi:MAG: glycosyltransferase family 4 protein [Oceanipulchritudo sp.]